MDSKISLKPCPFCGQAAMSGVSLPDGSGFELGFCGCKNPECHVKPKVGSTAKNGKGEASADRRWNIRL